MAGKPFKGKKKPNRTYANRKPLWTPLAGITQSALTKFVDNPEEFAQSYIDGVTSNKVKDSLEFGNLFHLCCEFQGKASAIAIAKKCCDSYQKTRGTSVGPKEMFDLQKLISKVRTVFPLYEAYWREKEKLKKWVSREKMFSVPYTFKDIDGKPVTINLVGKRDGVFRNKPGDLCLRETKTKSEINMEAIRDGLRADFQTLFYILAARLEFKEDIKEVDYNIIRNPGQHYTKTDSLQSYQKKIETDIGKRPSHYFARFLVTLSPDTIERFCQMSLDPALRRLLQWWRSVEARPFDRWASPYHLLNLPALTSGRYGRSDLYEKIIRGQRTGYSIRTTAFPELSESILN